MDSKLINRAEWDSLKADPRFRKYRTYLALWHEYIKDQWSEGIFLDEKANIEAWAKSQLLKDQRDLDYDDIRDFFITAELIKDTEEDDDSNDSE